MDVWVDVAHVQVGGERVAIIKGPALIKVAAAAWRPAPWQLP
jgi:hypothetical protein